MRGETFRLAALVPVFSLAGAALVGSVRGWDDVPLTLLMVAIVCGVTVILGWQSAGAGDGYAPPVGRLINLSAACALATETVTAVCLTAGVRSFGRSPGSYLLVPLELASLIAGYAGVRAARGLGRGFTGRGSPCAYGAAVGLVTPVILAGMVTAAMARQTAVAALAAAAAGAVVTSGGTGRRALVAAIAAVVTAAYASLARLVVRRRAGRDREPDQ